MRTCMRRFSLLEKLKILKLVGIGVEQIDARAIGRGVST